MNIPLLRRIQKRILKEPRQFQMDNWFNHSPSVYPNCGTAACIAGWAVTMSMKKGNPKKICQLLTGALTTDWTDNDKITRKAMKFLQLDTPEAAKRLFIQSRWPSVFRFHPSSEGTPEYAANAVARIDHFIATNGAE